MNAKELYLKIIDAIMYDYFRFYISGEYKEHFYDKKSKKCYDAVEVLTSEWFNFTFDEEKQKELSELLDKIDHNIIDGIVKNELCEIYKYTNTQTAHYTLDYNMYVGVSKAVKTLLKHEFHMSKEEIKALIKNQETY